MFRRRPDDDDPFAALKEAADRGSTEISSTDVSDLSTSPVEAFGKPEGRPRGDKPGATATRASVEAFGKPEGRPRGDKPGATATSASVEAFGKPEGRPRGDKPGATATAAQTLPRRASGGASTTSVIGVPGTPTRSPGKPHTGVLVLLLLVLSFGGAAAAVAIGERHGDSPTAAAHAPIARGHHGSGHSGSAKPAPATPAPKTPTARHVDLTTPAAFRAALRKARGSLVPGEAATLLRLTPEQLTITTRTRDGRQRVLDIEHDLGLNVVEAGDAGSRTALSLGGVDTAAPQREIDAAAALGRFPASRIDYLVLMPPIIPGDSIEWLAYFSGVSPRNSDWTAGAHGRGVHRLGEQPNAGGTTSTANSLTITHNGKTTSLSGDLAQRITDCVQRAGTDSAKIQACLP
ncbi:MAG TPA: hypothetical protein VGM91_07950 [Conexibacter sp.]|jgi:hypothetical protein